MSKENNDDLSDLGKTDDGLGSLSQSARQTGLGKARGILIFIGLLTAVVNAGVFFMADSVVDQQIRKEKAEAGPGVQFDEQLVKEIRDTQVKSIKVVSVGFILVGFVLCGLGIAIYKAPVVCTVLGLITYLVGWAVTVVMTIMSEDKFAISQSVIISIAVKIILVTALSKSIQTAIAYQREEQKSASLA